MKNLTFTCLAAGALLWGLGSCSSSNPETTTTPPAEEVATDRTTAPSPVEVVGNVDAPAGNDSVAAFQDSTSFYAQAVSIDMAEILASRQAKSKATLPEVKKYAEDVFSDHSKSNEELKKIGTMRGLTVRNTPLGVHQQMLNKVVNEKDADEFDEEYMDMQITLHKQAVELYESAAKNNTDAEFRAFANSTLPALRKHLEMAQTIRAKVK